jgi:hypothetical protein
MKQTSIILFLFALMIFGSCQSFYHTHYRGRAIVPVDGIKSIKQNSIADKNISQSIAFVESSKDTADEILVRNDLEKNADTAAVDCKLKKCEKKNLCHVKKQRHFIRHSNFFQFKKGMLARPFTPLKTIFIVILIMLTITLIVFGLSLIWWGIVLYSSPIILAGLTYFLVGTLPFFLFIRNQFHQAKPYKEKK